MQKAGETKAKENARWQGGAERKLRVLLRLLLILPRTTPQPRGTLCTILRFGQVRFRPCPVEVSH